MNTPPFLDAVVGDKSPPPSLPRQLQDSTKQQMIKRGDYM